MARISRGQTPPGGARRGGWGRGGGLLGAEGEAPAVEVGELEVRSAGEDGFDEIGLGDANAEVVVDGPEAGIEKVMSGRVQGQVVLMGSDPINRV